MYSLPTATISVPIPIDSDPGTNVSGHPGSTSDPTSYGNEPGPDVTPPSRWHQSIRHIETCCSAVRKLNISAECNITSFDVVSDSLQSIDDPIKESDDWSARCK